MRPEGGGMRTSGTIGFRMSRAGELTLLTGVREMALQVAGPRVYSTKALVWMRVLNVTRAAVRAVGCVGRASPGAAESSARDECDPWAEQWENTRPRQPAGTLRAGLRAAPGRKQVPVLVIPGAASHWRSLVTCCLLTNQRRRVVAI